MIVKRSEFHSSSYVFFTKKLRVGFLFAIIGLHIKSLEGKRAKDFWGQEEGTFFHASLLCLIMSPFDAFSFLMYN